MHTLELAGCSTTPFGSYLKALGVFRLVSEQSDRGARGCWHQGAFLLRSSLDTDRLVEFFVSEYRSTPILAPWNGGSGFYPNDNKDGIDAIASTDEDRFRVYRECIELCRAMPEVRAGKGSNEDERRLTILRNCRNLLPDCAVEWLDAAVGIAADGSRAFAPVVGTGGNEGRLDYTNNFMSRIAALLITAPKKSVVDELLRNALFGTETRALEKGAAGQYDPGRAGGANQGNGIEIDSVINPWDLILTLEGAVMWASGLYRRHGISYRAVMCSPFTVKPSRVGYGSAAEKDDSRAEIWAPVWGQRISYNELRCLLREGRASIDGRPARNGLEFAEAACSLGVDRGIEHFVRYSLLKRRGDSYIALPAGIFKAGFRSEANHIREFQSYFEELCKRDLPKSSEDLKRGVESAVFEALLYGGIDRMQSLMRAFGRMVRRILTTSEVRLPKSRLLAEGWLKACGSESPEILIAGALAGMRKPMMIEFLSRGEKRFAWVGRDLSDRMTSVLDKRLLAIEKPEDLLVSGIWIRAGLATSFIEHSTDDDVIEDLLFAFVTLDWRNSNLSCPLVANSALPIYNVLRRSVDRRLLSLLRTDDVTEAGWHAVARIRARAEPVLNVKFGGETDVLRLAASLLIPVLPFETKEQTKRE